MDIEDIEEGDKVVVDIAGMRRDGADVADIWDGRSETFGYVVGSSSTTIHTSVDPIETGVDPEDIPKEHRGENLPGVIKPRNIKAVLCDECDSEKIYADSIGEYLCPFCEEEKLE